MGMAGIERAQDGGGGDALAVVTKRATDAVGRRALANEATVLTRLSHPGVVRLVAHTETERQAQLVTERVPGSTLAVLQLDSPAALAAVGAAGAAVVADLHALGVAHGSLVPEHLIVSDGRVVLCSFGRAAEATPAAMDRDVADLVVAFSDAARRLSEPATRVERRGRRRLDELLVGAASRSLSASELGAALAALVGEADSSVRSRVMPVPAERTGADHGATAQPESATEARAITAVAGPERPAPETPTRLWRERVPRADRSASEVAASVPWHQRRNIVAGAGAGLAVVALWAVLVPGQRTTTPGSTPTAAAPAPPTPTPEPPSTVAPTPSPPPSQEMPRVVVVGNLVAIDDAWFELGRTGDIVRVGDWDCDGSSSPAVLRPASGEVFVFEGWVEGDATRRAEALTVVPGARDLSVVRSAGCDTLMAVDHSGHESVIEVTS
jgi:tRNA A-37 threonylcarbamoyl transferase component Bud32